MKNLQKRVITLGECFWNFLYIINNKFIKPLNIEDNVKAKLEHIRHDAINLQIYGKNTYYRFLKTLRSILETVKKNSEHFIYILKHEKAKVIIQEFFAFLKLKFYLHKREIYKVFRVLLVIFSFFSCLYVIDYVRNIEWALQVKVNGKTLGYVQNEFDFWEAEQTARKRVVLLDDETTMNVIPEFNICTLNSSGLTSERELADDIIAVWDHKITKASGIYIDGEFYGATTESSKLQSVLAKIKAERAKNIQNKGLVIFQNSVEIQDGMYPISSIYDFDAKILPVLYSNEKVKSEYVLAKGDTIDEVVKKFNMTKQEFAELNQEKSQLVPGDIVDVFVEKPLLDIKVVQTIKETEEVPFESIKIESTSYPYGTSFYKQRGKNGLAEVTYNVTYIQDEEVSRLAVSSKIIKKPVNEYVVIGKRRNNYFYDYSLTDDTLGDVNFIWPIESNKGYISCYFSGSNRHRGIDICAKAGTGILASNSGVIVSAGWEGTYGKSVVIQHENGLFTRYAHNSEIFVKIGQRVEQGEVIAAMGRTGNASGDHLHFEILKNGVQVDPLPHIS